MLYAMMEQHASEDAYDPSCDDPKSLQMWLSINKSSESCIRDETDWKMN